MRFLAPFQGASKEMGSTGPQARPGGWLGGSGVVGGWGGGGWWGGVGGVVDLGLLSC